MSDLSHRYHRSHSPHASHSVLSVPFWLTALADPFTLAFGLLGLLYGYIQTGYFSVADYKDWFIPANPHDPRRFLCAGRMQNSAYLGGVLSIPIAWAYQIYIRVKGRQTI